MKPSQSVSLQVQETAWWARESSASFKEGSLEPGAQQGRQSIQSAGHSLWQLMPKETAWHGAAYLYVELSCLSMVWSLPQLYFESLLGLLVSVLSPLMPRGEFPQEPTCGWSLSADVALLITWAAVLGVSPCQMCLLCLR